MTETPPGGPENVESQIEQLLAELDDFALDQFPAEAQDALADEWYEVEMEAKVGADRAHAAEQLRQFVDKLRANLGKPE